MTNPKTGPQQDKSQVSDMGVADTSKGERDTAPNPGASTPDTSAAEGGDKVFRTTGYTTEFVVGDYTIDNIGVVVKAADVDDVKAAAKHNNVVLRETKVKE